MIYTAVSYVLYFINQRIGVELVYHYYIKNQTSDNVIFCEILRENIPIDTSRFF